MVNTGWFHGFPRVASSPTVPIGLSGSFMYFSHRVHFTFLWNSHFNHPCIFTALHFWTPIFIAFSQHFPLLNSHHYRVATPMTLETPPYFLRPKRRTAQSPPPVTTKCGDARTQLTPCLRFRSSKPYGDWTMKKKQRWAFYVILFFFAYGVYMIWR